MDFLDYQTYCVGVPDSTDTETLPEPASNLSIHSTLLKDLSTQSPNTKSTFLLPASNSESEGGVQDVSDLNEKMQRYASLSLKLLPRNAHNSSAIGIPQVAAQKSDFQQLLKRNNKVANAVLTKRLSHFFNDINHPNYQEDLKLKKAFTILQDNQLALDLDNEGLVRSDFLGSLARKSLRSDIEREILKDHLAVLDHFQPIARRIKRFATPIEKIRERVNTILKIQEDNKDSIIMDSSVADLRKELNLLKLRKKLLVTMKNTLTLDQVEDEQLRNGSIDSSYFRVITKLGHIKERATHLINLDNPKAGHALLEKSNEQLQVANKRIYNFLMDFLYEYESISKTYGDRYFDSDDSSLTTFRTALMYLSNELGYFNEFLAVVISMRSKKWHEEFLLQFDVDNKSSKPIIISAHDPARYLGDVLAYVHSMIANEADFLRSLLKFESDQLDDVPKSLLQNNSEFFAGLNTTILNDIMGSLANSMKIRLEQIVRFEDDSLTNFDITQLLNLYQVMFIKHGILPESKLVKTLKDLEVLARGRIMQYYITYLSDVTKDTSPNVELVPPGWLVEYLSKLCALFEKLEKSSDNIDILNEEFFDKLILGPFQGTFLSQADSWFPLARKQKPVKYNLLILKINTFDLIITRLIPYHNSVFQSSSAQKSYDLLNQQLESFISMLEELQTNMLLELTGISLYYNLFNMIFPVASVQDQLDYEMYNSVMENPIMNLDTLKANVEDKLTEYLPKVFIDVHDVWLFNLTSPKIVDRICTGSLNVLSKFITVFRNVLYNLYPDEAERIASIMPYSEEEVQTLLCIN